MDGLFLGLLGTLLATSLLAASPYRVLVMGDSISVGYTDNPKWTVPYQFGFRSGLYTRLTNSGLAVQFVGGSPEPWDGHFGVPTNTPAFDLRAIGQDHCEGYGGKTTSYLLANLPCWLALDKPDVILLMIGINDIASGSTAEPVATEQNLSNIVATVVSTAPQARLIVAQITPRSNYTGAIIKYNTYIRDTLVPYFAAQGKPVTTVDQYRNLLVPGTTNIDATLFSNGINHPSAEGYERMAQTWLEGIRALALPPPQPPAPANLLTNGGFEQPFFATNNTHNLNPAGAGWSFTSGSSGAGSGIDRGDPYGSSGSSPIDGAQQAFLQSSGNGTVTRISQVISGFTPGRFYQLAFCAKAITGFEGANPFQVRLLDGSSVMALFNGGDIVPAAAAYTRYVSEPFRAAGSVLTLEFVDHGLTTARKVSWIDAVAITAMPAPLLGGAGDSGKFILQFNGFTNLAYQVLASSEPSPAADDWTFLGTATHLSNELFQFIDASAGNYPRRFYRLNLQ